MRDPEKGQKQKRGKVTRWICNWCLNKDTVSIYATNATKERLNGNI